jgi:imidazolonepropionase-like amidohydrolase
MKIFGSVFLVLISLSIAIAQETPTALERPLAFTHVTVIDATGASAKPDMTVIVTGNLITTLGKSSQLTVPPNAHVVDASGKYMIPGLWEMHTHAFIRSKKSFPLYVMYLFIAYGVTGVRDMGSPGLPDDFGDYPYLQDVEWRQAINEGAIIGPHLNLALTVINGPHVPGYPRAWAPVADATQAREEVDYLKKLGADSIKVYDQLSREAYFAIADEAKKQGMPFAGHVPILISAAEASDAGQKSLEHNYAVLFGCSSREKEFMQKEEDLYGAGKASMRGLLHLEDVRALVSSYDEEKAAKLFAKFVKNDTFVTPSLVRAKPERVPATDLRVVKYFSPALRAYVYPPNAKKTSPDVREAEKLMYQYHFRLVKAMQQAGVKMLVGTDSSFFGSAVHDEMAEMVKAGLTPMQALQTATKNAADYLGELDSMGTVEQGKTADLVLLDANPLQDISNTEKISAVVLNGRLMDRKFLDRLLTHVESAAHN